MTSAASNSVVRQPGESAVSDTVLKRAAAASFLGNFIEWFDYASYSYLATVIAVVFFPAGDPEVALLETFGVFALSFVLRPVGAVVWGNWGDKKGRKWALSTSILLMAGASFAIGCIPSYTSIGLMAPALLLLCRMVQGFSASGEYAGAATFLAEYSPRAKRGVYVSLVPASTACGLLFGSVFATVLHSSMSDAALHAWGWRIPFLLAAPLGLVTRYIRTHLEDSPVFTDMMLKAKKEPVAQPVRELLREHKLPLATSIGVATLNAVAFYLVLTYLPTYLTAELGYRASLASLASTLTLAVYVLGIFGMGWLSDHVGRKRMLIFASLGFIVLAVPLFAAFSRGSFMVIVLAEMALCLLLTANDGTMATYLTEAFPTRVRYTGFALSANLANAIFGGSASLVATWLIHVTGSHLAPAWYLVLVSVGALVAMLASRERSGEDLGEI